jgi:hypothetical protein
MLAFHAFHDTYGHFPADIRDKDGKPLLSWRVAILPYLEQQELYKQFRLTEPWDSEHNLKLLARMPEVYRVGFEPAGSTHTHYQVFAGPGTPFGPRRVGPQAADSSSGGSGGPGPPGLTFGPPASGATGPVDGGTVAADPTRPARIADILDGLSNTLGVVEAGPAVPWAKPADISYDPRGPFPRVAWPFANEMHVATMDGMAYALRRAIGERDFRHLIEMDDGNPVPELKSLRAPMKAETPEEKAALKELLVRNRERSEEVEKLLKEYVELLGGAGAADDPVAAEEQAEKLDQLIKDLRAKNQTIRDGKACRGGADVKEKSKGK